MYFNPQVKEKKEDFFDYEILQDDLKNAIEDKMTPLIAVYGLRRTGKTSLIKFAVRSEAKYTQIIKVLKGGAGWKEIKNRVKSSDKQLASMLRRLTNYGFVIKQDHVYTIADPLLEAAY